MLCAAQPDPFGGEIPRRLRIGGGIGVRAHADIAEIIGPVQQVWNASSSALPALSRRTASTSPVVPSTVIMSPAAELAPIGCTIIWSLRSITRSDAPTTQGSPMPRPITAAWLVTPPRIVKTADAACMPRISSGVVSRRTSTQASPRAALACASAAVKTIARSQHRGWPRCPRTITSRVAFGSTWRCNSSTARAVPPASPPLRVE